MESWYEESVAPLDLYISYRRVPSCFSPAMRVCWNTDDAAPRDAKKSSAVAYFVWTAVIGVGMGILGILEGKLRSKEIGAT